MSFIINILFVCKDCKNLGIELGRKDLHEWRCLFNLGVSYAPMICIDVSLKYSHEGGVQVMIIICIELHFVQESSVVTGCYLMRETFLFGCSCPNLWNHESGLGKFSGSFLTFLCYGGGCFILLCQLFFVHVHFVRWKPCMTFLPIAESMICG